MSEEGCSDTRLAAESVPRVNGDRLMMPLAHHISTMGKDMAMPASSQPLGDYLIDIVPPRTDCNNLRIDTSDI